MHRASAAYSLGSTAVPDRAPQVAAFVTAVLDAWTSLLDYFTDPYRPERHYMRGPGPKWRARHSHMPAPQDQIADASILDWDRYRRTSS